MSVGVGVWLCTLCGVVFTGTGYFSSRGEGCFHSPSPRETKGEVLLWFRGRLPAGPAWRRTSVWLGFDQAGGEASWGHVAMLEHDVAGQDRFGSASRVPKQNRRVKEGRSS